MLNKKQLEDSNECQNKMSCINCSMDGTIIDHEECIKNLSQTALELWKTLDYSRRVFKTLNNLGGLGHEKHSWIEKVLIDIDKLIGSDSP